MSVIEQRGKWYVANVEEMPGVNTQGRTLKEALTLVLEANRARCGKGRQLLYFPYLRKNTGGGVIFRPQCVYQMFK
jgi:hypothetical protein